MNEPLSSDERLYWHYGPMADDPDPGKMWHHGCGGEVSFLKESEGMYFYSCAKCGAISEHHPDE